MTPELIVQSLAIIVGALFSAFQIRNLIPRSRSRLKLDLEILALLDSTHPRYVDIRSDIDRRIDSLFPRQRQATPAVDEPVSGGKPDSPDTDTAETAREKQSLSTNRVRGRRLITKPGDFIAGVIMLSLGVPGLIYLGTQGMWGWAILPGVVAFLGFGGVLTGMEKE